MLTRELEQEIQTHRWWHRIDLGGIVTPGIDDSPTKLRHLHLPERLDGLTVIYVGAWDGYFSFECERRGAERVLATDHYCWTHGSKRGFDIAKQALGSRVEERFVRVEELSRATVGTFDLVLFLGVLYHAQDPMHYLRIMRDICSGLMIVETIVDAMDYPRPAMVFYPGNTLNNDPSNYWGPNALAVQAMLREVGFPEVEAVDSYYGNRMVFHAR